MIRNKKIIQQVPGMLVAANAIIFLLLAYLQVFSSTPGAIVFFYFWGSLCVYSLWFMAYEFYRNYIQEPGSTLINSI